MLVTVESVSLAQEQEDDYEALDGIDESGEASVDLDEGAKREDTNSGTKDILQKDTASNPSLSSSSSSSSSSHAVLNWPLWSDEIFAEARANNKLVLFLLVNSWSEDSRNLLSSSFTDEKVVSLIKEAFITVRVEADQHLLLQHLYPYKVLPRVSVLNSDKKELGVFEGYKNANKLFLFLYNTIHRGKPTPVDYTMDLSSKAFGISHHRRLRLLEHFTSRVDWYGGGYYDEIKFLPESLLSFIFANIDKKQYRELANRTLTANFSLFDPTWGGVFGSSKYGTWQTPSYEKLAIDQANNIYLYTLAYFYLDEPKYRTAAYSIVDFLEKFMLAPQGVFYSSQAGFIDSADTTIKQYYSYDDTTRRKIGIPAIDKVIRADVNARISEAYTTLYRASSKNEHLESAIRIAQWLWQNMQINESGGFLHSWQMTDASTYLADTLNFTRASFALYEVTQDALWLERAEKSLKYIARTFFEDQSSIAFSGAVVGIGEKDSLAQKRRSVKQNVDLVRIAIRLYHYTLNTEYRDIAVRAMAYLASINPDKNPSYSESILLADKEMSEYPLQFGIVGAPGEIRTQDLLKAVLAYPYPFSRIDNYQIGQQSSLRANLAFPPISETSIFVCRASHCSTAVFEGRDLDEVAKRILE